MRKTDIYIAITTFNRKEELRLLISDISHEIWGKNVHIHIYDDNSTENYIAENIYLGYNITRYNQNHGKKRYWEIINDIFTDAETWKFDYFFLLQDDCRLVEGFFDKAIKEFEEINDINKATLCTFTPQTVYNRTMWANQKAKDVIFNDKEYIKSNYVDCIFMCPRKTLEELKFKIEPIHSNRFVKETISSGVGQQVTIRLMRLKKTMWCAYSSLVISHSNKSKMNKKEREKNPLNPLIRERKNPIINLVELLKPNKKEKIIVGIASIKSREHILEKTINSLIDQIDEIIVYLNDYDKVPEFLLKKEKIRFYLGKIYKDRGDTAKYFQVDNVDGYYFSCDDDLIYPPDYVEKTVEFLEKNPVIVTYHGVILKKGKLTDYYKDRKQIHYSTFQREPIKVDIGGTGVMAFHTSVFRPNIKKFKYPNMSDIWVGIQAQEKKIPIYCNKRPLKWIKSIERPINETIYGSKKNHNLQTEVLNNYKNSNGEFK